MTHRRRPSTSRTLTIDKGGDGMKVCTHPARIGGKCLDCGAFVGGENGAEQPAVTPDKETAQVAPETPENGQKTANKTTRKRKA